MDHDPSREEQTEGGGPAARTGGGASPLWAEDQPQLDTFTFSSTPSASGTRTAAEKYVLTR